MPAVAGEGAGFVLDVGLAGEGIVGDCKLGLAQALDLVAQAGATMTEIVNAIARVSAIMAEIAAAATEQSTGIDQVNTALSQMDEVTQQNSALVEENAATAKTLEEQSTAMNERVGAFRLDQVAATSGSMRGTPASKLQAVAAIKRPAVVGRGAPRRMQAGLAVAVRGAPDWKEF